jgi:hypothetical protein
MNQRGWRTFRLSPCFCKGTQIYGAMADFFICLYAFVLSHLMAIESTDKFL